MFERIKKWWKKTPPPKPPQGPLDPIEEHDWVVVPYRVAEACRISIYTIGSHPDLPEELRTWIAQWLVDYNSALSAWFQVNYGPDIFQILEEITNGVRELSERVHAEEYSRSVAADFERWQQELQENEGE